MSPQPPSEKFSPDLNALHIIIISIISIIIIIIQFLKWPKQLNYCKDHRIEGKNIIVSLGKSENVMAAAKEVSDQCVLEDSQ